MDGFDRLTDEPNSSKEIEPTTAADQGGVGVRLDESGKNRPSNNPRGRPVRSPLGPYQRILTAYKSNARRDNRPFTLTLDEFYFLITSPCHWCGCQPSPTSLRNGDLFILANGIDRIDNTESYVIENCVPCCSSCNRAKSDLNYLAWITWLDQLTITHLTRQQSINGVTTGLPHQSQREAALRGAL